MALAVKRVPEEVEVGVREPGEGVEEEVAEAEEESVVCKRRSRRPWGKGRGRAGSRGGADANEPHAIRSRSATLAIRMGKVFNQC